MLKCRPVHISRRLSKTREHFAANAEDLHAPWLGLPWVRLGRGPDGFDCLGLVLAWYAANGYEFADPATMDDEAVLASPFVGAFDRSPQADFGDVARFAGESNHLGVVLFGQLLHVAEGSVVRVESFVPDVCEFWRLRALPC